MTALLLLLNMGLAFQATPPPAPQPAPAPAAAAKEEPAAAAKAEEPASAEPWKVELEAGYRVMPVLQGHFNTYRSLVNLGEGPRLLNGSLNYDGKTRFSITGSGLGDPFHSVRVSVYRPDQYEATFTSRGFLYYNFLPSFGNALLDRGILTPQRAYDSKRNWMEAALRLRPGRALTPYLTFARDRSDGTGITNWVANGNEYPLYNVMRDATNRFTGGLRYEKERYHFSIEQGGSCYDEDQLSSIHQRTPGTRLTPSLGQSLFLTDGEQLYSIRGNSLFTTASGSGSFGNWLGITGQYMYVRPSLDSTLNQNGTGNFQLPGSTLFVTSQSEVLTGQASMPRSSGIYNVNLTPMRRLKVLHSLWTDRFHTAGTLVSSNIADRLELAYNREQTEALVDLTSTLTVRAGHRYTWGDAKLRSPLVTPASTPNPAMSMHSLLAGAMLRNWHGLWLNADYERGDAGRVYFRTSLKDFSKGTLRARYRISPAWQLNWNTAVVDNQNPAVPLDYRQMQNGLSLLWTPKSQWATVIADYTRSSIRSTLPYLVPSELTPAISRYRDNAHTATLMLDVKGPHAVRLTAGGAYVRTSGSRPSSFPQPEARVYVPVHKLASVFGEWRYWGYGQPFYSYETFRAHQLTVGLRFAR